jgi:Ca2+:H+ antiporter
MQQLLPTHREQRDQSTTHVDRQEETETRKGGRGQLDVSPARQQQTPAKKTHSKSATQQTPSQEVPPSYHGLGKQPSFLPINLPDSITTEEFTRAVAHATVSALRQHASAAQRLRPIPANELAMQEEAEQGGHEGPSWSRGVSTAVLLACTLLYALIAGESR